MNRIAVRLFSTKLSTGIVGLSVVPNAREVLISLYEKTLDEVKIMPDHVPYRKDVENFTNWRMQVVKDNQDITEIERIVGTGQVEELIEQAKDELKLIPEYSAWKCWELPQASPDDDEFQDIYEDLEFIDPDSVEYLGLKELALKKRAEAAANRA
jgi:NADH dehydrogenase (ubiquinone) 1 alpha subcomplex subunit 5